MLEHERNTKRKIEKARKDPIYLIFVSMMVSSINLLLKNKRKRSCKIIAISALNLKLSLLANLIYKYKCKVKYRITPATRQMKIIINNPLSPLNKSNFPPL